MPYQSQSGKVFSAQRLKTELWANRYFCQMHIHSATFTGSHPSLSHCPPSSQPEYAFIGRSNVGKSSLINMLTQRKGLAKISGKPGKTRLINRFLINDSWYLTDLPGYGYAKVSRVQQEKFAGMIADYILKRENLTNLFLLIDVRLPPQVIDLDFMNWLGENEVPFAMVFTKIDKLTGIKVQKQVRAYNKKVAEYWAELPVQFLSSAETSAGRVEILSYIGEVNRQMGSPQN